MQTWQSGDFGKYGIGLFTLFKFGQDVTIQIDTKQRTMRERMVSAVIDYQKMRKSDRFEIEKISNPIVDKSVFPDHASQGTRILIKNVCQQFWDSCTVPTTHKLKKEILEEISEKYTLYLYGMTQLKETLLKCKGVRAELLENIRSTEIGMDALPRIEVLIDDESMCDVACNRVVSRMATIAGAESEAVCDADAGDSSSPVPGTREGRDSRRQPQRAPEDVESQNGDAIADSCRPCWYTSWKVETRTGTSAATAHVRCSAVC